MEWLRNFYLGTHSHYQNITPRGASQSVKSEKKKFFFNFFNFFWNLHPWASSFRQCNYNISFNSDKNIVKSNLFFSWISPI